MAASAGAPAISPPFWWGGLLLALLIAVAVWLGGLLPHPWGGYPRQLLQRLHEPALASVMVLAASWMVLTAVRARSRQPLPAAPGREEPLLSPPDVPSCQSGSPVVALAGLEPGAGVSTLTFNLAVSLAVQGEIGGEAGARGPRPICLLTEGALTEALGLSPQPLEEHLRSGPHRVGAKVANLAVRHVSGCELLCLAAERRAAAVLALLVRELRDHYDAVLVDAALRESVVLDVALEAADALLLVGLPTSTSVEAAGLWIERVWSIGLEPKTALLLNRVAAWPRPPRELALAFLYQAQLPEEPGVQALDRRGLPWAADGSLGPARQLTAVVRQLFPTLMRGATPGAA